VLLLGAAVIQEDKAGKRNVFRRHLARHIVLAAAVILLIAYYILRELRPVADFVTSHIALPWHRFAGGVFNVFPFSVAEWLCALAVVGVLVYLVYTIIKIIRKPKKLQRVYAFLVTLLAAAVTVYTLVCWFWGIGFYSQTYEELSGIETTSMSTEQLKEVTIYFAEAANAAGEEVPRDGNGLYVCDIPTTLSDAPALYTNLPEQFGFLMGSDLRPKPLVFSYLMSELNYTGVFFPFTGEANVNVQTPSCFIPSTVAHELSHQRGVFREQDANFTAVMVCMQSSDPNFVYSGALLAYVNLDNALRQASYKQWLEASAYLGDNARRDLAANDEYWAQFETPTAQISHAAYGGFLQNQGQALGMRSYGACVDLLVAYYGESAEVSATVSSSAQSS